MPRLQGDPTLFLGRGNGNAPVGQENHEETSECLGSCCKFIFYYAPLTACTATEACVKLNCCMEGEGCLANSSFGCQQAARCTTLASEGVLGGALVGLISGLPPCIGFPCFQGSTIVSGLGCVVLSGLTCFHTTYKQAQHYCSESSSSEAQQGVITEQPQPSSSIQSPAHEPIIQQQQGRRV